MTKKTIIKEQDLYWDDEYRKFLIKEVDRTYTDFQLKMKKKREKNINKNNSIIKSIRINND